MLYEVSGCGSSVFGKAVAWLFAVAVLPCSVAAQAAQNWVEVRTPHFILLSNTDSRRARNVALEFEQARELFRVAISPDAGQDTALPVVIFAVRNRADLRVLLPGLEGELPIGVFRRSPDQHSIAVRLDEPSEQRFHTVYHEYHHLLFRSAVARAPVWLTEGLAEFWSTMETRRDGSMEIGRPNPRHLRALRLGSMMPLARLLAFDGHIHDQSGEAIAVFYAQSWAVVHYLMLGDGAGGRRTLDRYIGLVERGGDPVEAFVTVYGSVRAVEIELAEHVDRTMFPAMRTEVPPPPPASEFQISELSDGEAYAAIGTFVATGPWPREARGHLERALADEPGSTAAMEGMGYMSLREGDLEAAEAWFEKAADSDETSYVAHYYKAVLLKQRMGPDDEAEASLRRAIELNPSFAPAFVVLSAQLAADVERLDEALALATKATELAPDVSGAWRNLAHVLERMGREDEARQAMERGSDARQ